MGLDHFSKKLHIWYWYYLYHPAPWKKDLPRPSLQISLGPFPKHENKQKKARMIGDGDLGWSEIEMPWWWMGLRARYWCRGMRDGPAWGEVRDGLAGRSGKKCSLIIGAWIFRIFCSLILPLYDDHHITIVPFVHLWGFKCVQYFFPW